MSLRPDVVNDELVRKVLKRLGKTQTVNGFNAKMGTKKGDNFMGDVLAVDVELSDGEVLHWMVKAHLLVANEGMDFARKLNVFRIEANVYQILLPAFAQISEVDAPLAPTCNFIELTDHKEALVLEHMGYHGWRDAYNKLAGLDLNHVNLVMDWMAKFHGLSYVTLKRHANGVEGWLEENDWAKGFTATDHPELREMEKNWEEPQKKNFQGIAKILDDGSGNEYKFEERLDKLYEERGFVGDLRRFLDLPKEGEFNTLCHGDPWFNNMLFHFGDDPTTPDNVMLLDYQVIMYSDPGHDLAQFLLTSTTREFRQQHLDSLLRRYHQKLLAVASNAGEDLSFFKFSDLEASYKRSLVIGITFGMMAMPLILAEEEDKADLPTFSDFDMTDEAESKKFVDNEQQRVEKTLRKSPRMQSRLRGILLDMIDAGLL